MWPFRRASQDEIPTFAVDNVIGPGTRVRGDLRGPGGFRIDGTVEGGVDADGPVVVGEGGTVEGGIRARDIVVLGRVRGDVRATGHLEIGPKGKVVGDMTVQSFRLHKGGVFRGTSRMPGGEELGASLPFPELSPANDLQARRGRTLPPPGDGAVPPPPVLEGLHALTPVPASSEGLVSQERIVTPDDGERERATG